MTINLNTDQLIEVLPSGSGFDCKWELEKICKNGKAIFSTDFHNMSEHGYYDGYTHIRITLNTSDLDQFRLTCNGKARYTQWNDRDYYYSTIQYALQEFINKNGYDEKTVFNFTEGD